MWNTKATIKQCQIRNACFQMFYYFHYSACYLFTTFFSAYLDYIKPLICWSFSRIWVIACTCYLKQVVFLLKLYILTGRKLEKVIVLPNMKIIYNSSAPLSSTTSGNFLQTAKIISRRDPKMYGYSSCEKRGSNWKFFWYSRIILLVEDLWLPRIYYFLSDSKGVISITGVHWNCVNILLIGMYC